MKRSIGDLAAMAATAVLTWGCGSDPAPTVGTGGTGAGTSTGSGGGGYGRGVGLMAPRHARAPRVIPGQATVRGSLDKHIIKRVIRLHINEVRFCYEQELGTHPELAGKVAVQFVISDDGKVTTSFVSSTTLGNLRVETCIAQAVRRWAFPAVKGGGLVIVNYPFVLLPRPHAQTTSIPAGRRLRRGKTRVHSRRRSCCR